MSGDKTAASLRRLSRAIKLARQDGDPPEPPVASLIGDDKAVRGVIVLVVDETDREPPTLTG